MPKLTKKYYILVLGCQMNESDGEKLEKILINLGFARTLDERLADVITVVACSVKQTAIDHICDKARQWKRKRREGKLLAILTGCVLDADKEKMSTMFDHILPIDEIGKLKEIIKTGMVNAENLKDYLELPSNYNSKFQAYVPIMTGCNNFCSYCAVPYARGREKSRPADEIIKECRKLIKNGYKEIVLLGQNVNSYAGKYRKEDSEINFPQLLKMIDSINGDFWLRFLTSHPKNLSDELIQVMAGGKHITPYLHLALQSGDDEILKVMNRKYSAKHFEKIVAKARKAIPGIMISTDIIVGFPGETKNQFNNTAKLMERVGFDMAYISEYSPREGTAAAKFKDNISGNEKTKRKNLVNEILKKTAKANNQKYVGQELKVLVDKFKVGKCHGKTDTFKTVTFNGKKSMLGKFAKVKIKRVESWGLFG